MPSGKGPQYKSPPPPDFHKPVIYFLYVLVVSLVMSLRTITISKFANCKSLNMLKRRVFQQQLKSMGSL